MQFIHLKRQQAAIRSELDRRMAAVLEHGQYIMGPEVAELEQTLAGYVGVKHCVSVASGTEALLISLMALGVGPGDEVITTPFSFVATAEVIVLLGATAVFADIDPLTANLNPVNLERLITPRTKAIIPVSLYGQPADMDEVNAIAAAHGDIPVIEDAAQSFGSMLKSRRSCGLSTIGCTSFFPSKPLGCYGDGGALFTDDDEIARACRETRVHGQSQRYVHTRIGVGGRMDTLQCAVLLAKWPRFAQEVEERVRLGKRYHHQILDKVPCASVFTNDDALNEFEGPRLLPMPQDCTNVHAQFTIVVPKRERVIATLKERGIPTAVHYPGPLNAQPAYVDIAGGEETPVAAWMSQHVLSLPMGPDLLEAEQDKVVEALAGHFA